MPIPEEEDDIYSFYSSDSYELLVKDPDPAKTRKRPQLIPPLDFDNLPSYESTSEEEEEAEEAQQEGENNPAGGKRKPEEQYQESMEYIDKYYQKHKPTDQENGPTIPTLQSVSDFHQTSPRPTTIPDD